MRPATVTDADLDWLVFPATVSVTVPLPVPVAPAVMLIHGVCSDADHLQPTGDVTVIVTVPPAKLTDCDLGETSYVQGPAVTVIPLAVAVCPHQTTKLNSRQQ